MKKGERKSREIEKENTKKRKGKKFINRRKKKKFFLGNNIFVLFLFHSLSHVFQTLGKNIRFEDEDDEVIDASSSFSLLSLPLSHHFSFILSCCWHESFHAHYHDLQVKCFDETNVVCLFSSIFFSLSFSLTISFLSTTHSSPFFTSSRQIYLNRSDPEREIFCSFPFLLYSTLKF